MDINLFMSSIKNKLPGNKAILLALSDRIQALPQAQQDEFFQKRFPLIELKNPLLILAINFFLGQFGIARFMINSNAIGALRLFATLALIVLCVIADDLDETHALWGVIGILMLAILVWSFVELFLVDIKVRKQNFEKIISAL